MFLGQGATVTEKTAPIQFLTIVQLLRAQNVWQGTTHFRFTICLLTYLYAAFQQKNSESWLPPQKNAQFKLKVKIEQADNNKTQKYNRRIKVKSKLLGFHRLGEILTLASL